MIACHAFTWYTMWPDPDHLSCYSKYGNQPAANILEHDGSWHHVAVTWTAAHNGTTKVYKDGLLMAEVKLSSAWATLNDAPVEYCMQQTWQHCKASWSMPMTCNCQSQCLHVAKTAQNRSRIQYIKLGNAGDHQFHRAFAVWRSPDARRGSGLLWWLH